MSAFFDPTGRQTVYVGIDTNMLRLKPAWRISGTFPTRPGELLLGSEAALVYHWRLGDETRLPGIPGPTGMVKGILAPTHGAEDSFIHVRLADAQPGFGTLAS